MAATPEPPADSKDVDRPIPLPVALSVMGAILLGGAALIWHYAYRPPATSAIHTVVPSPQNPRMAGGPPTDARQVLDIAQMAAEENLPDGVHTVKGGDVLVKAGDAYMRLVHAGDKLRPSFGYFTLLDQEWEHGYLTQGVRRLLTQEEFARELALSNDQKSRLEKIIAAPAARWPDADRTRLLALYQDPRTRKDIVSALKTYATQRREADQKVMAERVEQIRSILTEKQLARINPIPKWPLTPASLPSAPGRAPRDP